MADIYEAQLEKLEKTNALYRVCLDEEEKQNRSAYRRP